MENRNSQRSVTPAQDDNYEAECRSGGMSTKSRGKDDNDGYSDARTIGINLAVPAFSCQAAGHENRSVIDLQFFGKPG